MRDPFRAQIADVLRALVVRSATRYTWFGEPMTAAPRADDGLATHLLDTLYTRFYCSGGATPDSSARRTGTASDRRWYVDQLSAANRSAGYAQGGWELVELRADGATVRRDGLLVRVPLTAHAAGFAGCEPGDEVTVWQPNESLAASNGFYTAFSERDLASEQGMVRLYFNLGPAGALLLLERASSLLNAQNIAHRIKVLSDPASFGRCDSAVLYLPRDLGPDVMRHVSALHAGLAGHLRAGVPALTRPLARGLGLAEDPPGNDSFGMSRCRIVAEVIVAAHARGVRCVPDRLQQVAAAFEQRGLDPEHPYLGSPTSEVRRWVLPEPRTIVAGPGTTTGVAQYEALARDLGRGLVDTAIWSGRACAWLTGAVEAGRAPVAARRRFELMGGEPSSGTAGVAMFLAALAAASGDHAVARTAIGAIRHAIASAAAIPRSQCFGLWRGALGVACAAGRVGALLGCEDALEFAAHVAAELEVAPPPPSLALDAGLAGAALGCLVLDREVDRPGVGRRAQALAAELARRVEAALAGRSNLGIGYAAGAAGIGHALLEAASRVDAESQRTLAWRIFAREAADREALLRSQGLFADAPPATRARPVAFETLRSWADGAAGIGFSRVRARALAPGAQASGEAEAAVRDVQRCLDLGLRSRTGTQAFSPGMLGCAEVLLDARDVLPGVRCDQAFAVGDTLVEALQDPHQRRMLLADGGPGLFAGISGLGWFLLRLAGATRSPARALLPRADRPDPSAIVGPNLPVGARLS